MFKFSKASLELFKNIHPNLINFMKELIKISPYDFKITAGARTAEEQNKIYQQGRTVPGYIITYVDGYKKLSNHQLKYDGLGYAVDIGVLIKEKVIQNQKEIEKVVYKGSWKDFHYYKKIYDTAKNAGLLEKYNIEWGGNCWKSFIDAPHWQIKGADKVKFKGD